jgi:internalin A
LPDQGSHGHIFVAVDGSQNVYRAYNNIIRVVDRKGVIRSFTKPSAGRRNPSGDGGPPSKTVIGIPWGMKFDTQGNLYVADVFFGVVRKISAIPALILTLSGPGSLSALAERWITVTASCNLPCQIVRPRR